MQTEFAVEGWDGFHLDGVSSSHSPSRPPFSTGGREQSVIAAAQSLPVHACILQRRTALIVHPLATPFAHTQVTVRHAYPQSTSDGGGGDVSYDFDHLSSKSGESSIHLIGVFRKDAEGPVAYAIGKMDITLGESLPPGATTRVFELYRQQPRGVMTEAEVKRVRTTGLKPNEPFLCWN